MSMETRTGKRWSTTAEPVKPGAKRDWWADESGRANNGDGSPGGSALLTWAGPARLLFR